MKLEEAIKNLESVVDTPPCGVNQDFMDSVKLGIEALERIKRIRGTLLGGSSVPRAEFSAFTALLPSETYIPQNVGNLPSDEE